MQWSVYFLKRSTLKKGENVGENNSLSYEKADWNETQKDLVDASTASVMRNTLGLPSTCRLKTAIVGGVLAPTFTNTVISNNIPGYTCGGFSKYDTGNYHITLPEAYSNNNISVSYRLYYDYVGRAYDVIFTTTGDTLGKLLIDQDGTPADIPSEEIIGVELIISLYPS